MWKSITNVLHILTLSVLVVIALTVPAAFAQELSLLDLTEKKIHMMENEIVDLYEAAPAEGAISGSQVITPLNYEGVLRFDPLPTQVAPGNQVVFSGQLSTTAGHVVTNATIYIKDDIDFGSDDIIAITVTNSKGEFYVVWDAVQRSSGKYDFYAVFEGSSNVSYARSQTHSLAVAAYSTIITLDNIPQSIYAGEQINFTGTLSTSQGNALSNATIYIQDEDTGSGDDILAQGVTDSNGRFSIPWIAEAQVEVELEIRAVFEGSGPYARSATSIQKMSVVKYSGSINLDNIPVSSEVGDAIIFSGTLTLEGHNPEGAAVYIKDEDPLNPDDLLATGFVKSNGKFSANWFVTNVDEDSIADIYAVFEGSTTFYRLTTCDDNPTLDLGGSCTNTIPLEITDSTTTTPPRPTSDPPYMKLYYAKSLVRDPHVIIVPSRDSFEDVRGHISPVQEGILMWTNALEYRYGGNWNVTFEVMLPGKINYDSRPDVIVNLVTHETQTECFDSWYGVAYLNPHLANETTNTIVCSTSNGVSRSNDRVAATAAHEFIHAMGLGHTFNKPKDLMCSVEDGIPTCVYIGSKSTRPSNLNLDAVKQIYKSDGYKNPNNFITYEERFYENAAESILLTPLSTVISDSNQITVTFNRPVSATPFDFTNLEIMPGGIRNVVSVAGSGTNTLTILFDGNPTPTNATATITLGSGISDLAGNRLAQINDYIVNDAQPPTLLNVSIISDNADPSTAVVGDTITITFTASEEITGTSVIMNGVNISATSPDNISWTATGTITTADLARTTIAFAINYADMSSNLGSRVTLTTDGTAIKITDATLGVDSTIITGTVFSDTNWNGIQDTGELGYPEYTMYATDKVTGIQTSAVTTSDGTYSFDVIPGNETIVQTYFFPQGHVVYDVRTSWHKSITVLEGQTFTFDVGFHPITPDEQVSLNLLVYLDTNRNGVHDAGERTVDNLDDFYIYTYTIGPVAYPIPDDVGRASVTDLVPADFAVLVDVEALADDGYAWVTTSYEKHDNSGTQNILVAPVVYAPEPGSTYTMMVGLG